MLTDRADECKIQYSVCPIDVLRLNNSLKTQKSSPNLNFHPGVEVHSLIRFTIMAVTALAILCAFQSCVKTLTIFFLTQRFFAGALSHWNVRGDTFEIVRLPVIYDASCSVDLFFISAVVPTAYTDTVLIACFSFSEALAIEFQAINFCAFATDLRKLPRRQIKLVN